MRLLETGWPALLVWLGMRGHRGLDLGAAAACRRRGCSARSRLPAPSCHATCAGSRSPRSPSRSLGLWWGTLRNDALDRSVLAERIGRTAPARVVVTGPVAPDAVRGARAGGGACASARRSIRERVLLELPPERAPPQGAVLELRARPVAPRGPETGFDERGWLARRGIHVVLRGDDAWRVVGRRGGIGGVGDRLRAHVEATLARGTDGGAPPPARRASCSARTRASTASCATRSRRAASMHLLAVSGQNVAIVAVGVVMAARIVGLGRLVGEALAILVVLAYALAVGWQPSVVRAAVAGTLASLAWIVARPRDRWHALAVGALVLLAWMPRSALEPGFQLSFAAVAAIFLVLPRMSGVPDAYPVPRGFWDVLVVAVACGLVTAPIVWLHFGRVALWTVPANIAAEPAMPPLISLSLAAAAVEPVLPGAATSLAWLAGLVRVVARVRRADRLELAVGAGLVAGGHRDRRPARRGRRPRPAAAALPASRGRRSTRVARTDRLDGRVRAPPVAVLDGADRPPRHVSRRRSGRFRPRRGAGCRRARRRRAAGGGRGRPASASRREVADRDRPHASAARPHRRRAAGRRPAGRRCGCRARDRRRRRPTEKRCSPPHAASAYRSSSSTRARSFELGKLELRILWPDDPGLPSEDPNQHAVVALASYGTTDVLLTADAESDVTSATAPPPGRGPEGRPSRLRGPGLPDLLRVLRPTVAVISVGAHNDYDHPRPETLAALAAQPGLRTLRTDVNGRIVVESDGRTLTVRSER